MIHFPLRGNRFEHDFGVRALLAGESILERTDAYEEQVALKRHLLRTDPDNYYRKLPHAHEACGEAADFLEPLVGELLGHQPNCLGGDKDAEVDPLLSLAKRVQEDLAVLSGDPGTGHAILAGVVCFPSGWSISQKIGKSMDGTHAPVPEYASVFSKPVHHLLNRLKVNRPVWRMNWGVRGCGQLDQSPKHDRLLKARLARLTGRNVGQRCFFRVERQTLSRLPETNAILFTIHTHQCRLDALGSWQRQRLLGVLETCPAPVLEYKGIAAMREPLFRYLSSQC